MTREIGGGGDVRGGTSMPPAAGKTCERWNIDAGRSSGQVVYEGRKVRYGEDVMMKHTGRRDGCVTEIQTSRKGERTAGGFSLYSSIVFNSSS